MRRSAPKHQRGLTLVEVLVAFLVLSLGLIGIASLHLLAVQGSHGSLQRSVSAVIALDLEEWLWEAFSDPALAGCPDFAATLAELEEHWQRADPDAPVGRADTWPEAPFFQLPELSLDLVTLTASPDGTWVEGLFTIGWNEARFVVGGDGRETFEYTARVACRS